MEAKSKSPQKQKRANTPKKESVAIKAKMVSHRFAHY